MKITIDVKVSGNTEKSIIIDAVEKETVADVALRAAKVLELESYDLIDGLEINEGPIGKEQLVEVCVNNGKHWEHRRTCLEIHYQSEPPLKHTFSPKRLWLDVHKWACHHFQVAEIACQDLELFEGSPTGTPLNESLPIGFSSKCKDIWLAKRGPEQNG